MRIHARLTGFSLLALVAAGWFNTAARADDLAGLLWRPGAAESRLDANGRVLSAEALRDRIAVVTFVSAGCTIPCAIRTMDLDRLAGALPGSLRRRVVFLAIDTDPAADDAGRLRKFAESLVGPAPHLRFLPSDADATRALAEALRYPAAALPEPPPTILLFDRRGQVAMAYGGAPLDAPRLVRDIATLDTFTQGLGRPSATAPGSSEPAR